MRPYAAYQIHHLLCSFADLNTADRLKKFFVKIINMKIVMTKRRLTMNLLEKIQRKGIGTNQIECFSRYYGMGGGRGVNGKEKEIQRKRFIRREMNVRIQDSRECLQKAVKDFRRYMRYFDSIQSGQGISTSTRPLT